MPCAICHAISVQFRSRPRFIAASLWILVFGTLFPGLSVMAAGTAFPQPDAQPPEADAKPVTVTFGTLHPRSAEMHGRDVVVVLDGAVSPALAEQLSRMDGLIESVAIGYDTVRLHLTGPAVVRTVADGVLLTPQGPVGGSPAWEQRRLMILQAQLQAQHGETRAAQVRLATALQDRPDDVDLLAGLASLDERAGRWHSGLTLYDQILSDNPGAEEIARARDALGLRVGPQLRTDVFVTASAGGERTQSVLLNGAAPLSEEWRADIAQETRHESARNVLRSDGLTGGAIDTTRVRSEFGVTRTWGEDDTTRAAVHLADGGPGFAAQHRVTWAWGTTTFSGDYKRPYWDTLTSLRANASRDLVEVQQEWQLSPAVAAELGGGGERYGIPAQRDLTKGGIVTAGLTWTLPARAVRRVLPQGWAARVGYQLASEYISSVATPYGRGLPPLDVRRREIHAAEATVERLVGPGLLTATGGYAIDRYGGSGPVARLRYARADDEARALSFGVEGSLAPSLAQQSRVVWQASVFLLWRFGMGTH